ncbi:ABC transporter permease/substrate-binding protein [Jeotgalibaca caeni]|uniref:ABC transporter permease/substrate-binding protein n=1 Tax=Jeotgalibaca caeni TaxID=3028623 RepID=UPI00237D6B5E|nr:ABC transporter permease/substrate-binding protein [Jeotgalibaca caeni]MDE1549453.1 ABC transporter permease/substrate-binding protein [Jeotgalibaca caeni]
MNTLLQTFQERSGDLGTAFVEHIQLSMIALLIAIVIAVPLGIFLTNHKKIASPIIQVTAVFQTIPSLAILGLLIPLVGIGTVPAIIALVVYALLPILRNTYTGLSEIDPALLEAADAMGMNRQRKLMKVQLPLAMPIIIAGIRTAMVMIIGTATIAALIGAGGLGSLILLGIDRGNNTLILLGAIPSALLAILFDGFIGLLQRISVKKSAFILGATALAMISLILVPFLLEEDDLTAAGKLGTEPEILMNIYKLLIEEHSDLTVAVEPNFGKTTFVFNALRSGQVDLYPEFTGTVLSTFLNEDLANLDEETVYQQAKDGLATEYDLTLLEPMDFNNTYVLAVTKELAEEYELETISDLAGITNDIQAGFTLEFSDRQDGYLGIQEVYGISFPNLSTMEPQLRYEAIANGEINLIDAYSTDSELARHELVVLEDDLRLFPPYQGAPLLRQETLTEYPELAGILNQLAGLITDDEMREMNYQVDVGEETPEKVARQYLMEAGLLE